MFSISSYFSVEYLLILLPLCILLYRMLPKTARRVTLLFFSYAFFWAVSGKLIVYLLAPMFDYLLAKVKTQILIPICIVLAILFGIDQIHAYSHPNMAEGAIEAADAGAAPAGTEIGTDAGIDVGIDIGGPEGFGGM